MKRYITVLFAIIGIPMSTFASNSIAKASGIADGMLLFLLLGFIFLLLAIIAALAKSIEGISKSPNFNKLKKNEKTAKAIAIIVLLGSSFNTYAAEAQSSSSAFMMSNTVFWLLLCFIGFLAIIIGILFNSLNTLLKLERGDSFEQEKEEETEDIFTKLKLTDRVPAEEESNIMMDHEYDGIRELDNNLPPWWKYMFYATIIFAFVYLIRFHITGSGQLQGEEYAAEMEAAVAAKAEMMANATESITEENVIYLVDAPNIEKGGAIYQGNCATCHSQLGGGGAGPNLTDEYWIHGGGIKNVFKTIKYGVPAKGMIAWQSQFSPSQMQQISSYVLSLQGSNPPGGKDPQGEIYVEEIITKVTDSTAADTTTVVVEIDE